jgi:hypothetical protein
MRIIYATDRSKGVLAATQLLACLPLDTDCQLIILTVVSREEKESRYPHECSGQNPMW